MTTTLIHFGLAKTATTYLQKAVFPQAGGVNYLGKPFRSPARSMLHYLSHHKWDPPLDRFLKDESRMRSHDPGNAGFPRLERQLRRALCPQKLNIWSHEGLLRPTRDNGPFATALALRNMRGVFRAAGSDRTHALLVLRDTRSLMASYARQFLHELESRGLEDCDPDDLRAARAGTAVPSSAARLWRLWYCYFDFGAVIGDLHGVFGGERVHVLNYDVLAHDWSGLQDVVSGIAPAARLDFPAVTVNESRAKVQAPCPRLARHLKMLEGLDLTRLYPDNDRHLDQAASGVTPR